MDFNDKESSILDRVFRFYIEHKEECDSSYIKAEDKKIVELYEVIEDNTIRNTLFAKTAIVVLTANKYEKNILHKRIYELTKKKIKRIEVNLFTACRRFRNIFAYWFEWNGHSVLNIHANVTGSHTIGGSSDILRWVFRNEYLFPKTVISLGICFGTSGYTGNLGDVIISRKVYPYFVGAKIKGEDLHVVDDNAFGIADVLYNKINNLIDNNQLNMESFNVEFGNYITGEAVVSSESAREKFESITSQEIYSGDMEGYGLFKECTSDPYSVPCVIIKSICDWGTQKNFDVNDTQVLSKFQGLFIEYRKINLGKL